MSGRGNSSTTEDRSKDFRRLLLAWYDANARDLPWRQGHDPYRVWISEIMLQQTRVAAVIEHYHEFLRRFPTVQRLARAHQPSVLAAWSGLGYYRRARMLHAAAKVIAMERGGRFPQSSREWLELPGIGRYTASAIASIAFGEPVAVVDGNVERVLQRFSGQRLSGEQFWKTAEELLDHQRPGDFNQAMMELGAMVCTPRAPGCLMCPVVELCATRGEMPASGKMQRQHKREIHYGLQIRDGHIFLVQRPTDSTLMASMWELPELRRPEKVGPPLLTVRHSITVTDYTVRVWTLNRARNGRGKWFSDSSLSKIPLTGLTRKILRKAGISPAANPQSRN
ncbi:MAG TPA: A/G-specific adenine glycosylase [Candidatus Sulfotelmatobacter sp.]|nr:A/G-specific adenine glycosylase [Candidatus Sulfotelmatobacter sp.]